MTNILYIYEHCSIQLLQPRSDVRSASLRFSGAKFALTAAFCIRGRVCFLFLGETRPLVECDIVVISPANPHTTKLSKVQSLKSSAHNQNGATKREKRGAPNQKTTLAVCSE